MNGSKIANVSAGEVVTINHYQYFVGVVLDGATWLWLSSRHPALDAEQVAPGYFRICGVIRLNELSPLQQRIAKRKWARSGASVKA